MSSLSEIRQRAMNLGLSGNFEDAAKFLTLALEQAPEHLPTRVNLGVALHALGRYVEALEHFDIALAKHGDHAELLSNKCLPLLALSRFQDAIASAQAALSVKPHYPEALNNLGAAYLASGHATVASDCFRDALRFRPKYAKALANLGVSLQSLQLLPEALGELQEAFELDPNIEGLAGAILHLKMKLCIWDTFEVDRDRLLSGIKRGQRVAEPFVVLSVVDDPQTHRQVASIKRSQFADVTRGPIDIVICKPRSRIRIGYFSADYANHATTHLLNNLISVHDREQFEIYGFSLAPFDDDPTTIKIKNAFDKVIELYSIGDCEAKTLVRSLGIDVAVDLNGYTQNARPGLFERRVAPLQVGFLGYPGTSASPLMDYLIADRVVIPSLERPHYDEKIIFMPDSYQVNSVVDIHPTTVITRAAAGLPDDGIVFVCFNNTHKITPVIFESWLRILEAVPASVLWLLDDNRTASANLRRRAESFGISRSRIVFSPRVSISDHLARHRCADIFLDTFPYNAHTTASDALRMGLPVVTIQGRSFPSRVASSLLRTLGVEILIASTHSEYEETAKRLAGEPRFLAECRERIASGISKSSLFKPKAFAKCIEDAFRSIVSRAAAGLPAADLHLPPSDSSYV